MGGSYQGFYAIRLLGTQTEQEIMNEMQTEFL